MRQNIFALIFSVLAFSFGKHFLGDKILRLFTAIFLVSIFCLLPQSSSAQVKSKAVRYDSTYQHSAKKATIMSACLPGLGQAYNKKYWKIPVLYAGFGTLAYFISVNGKEYRKFKDAYTIVATGDTLAYESNDYILRYDANLDQLKEGRNYYRRNLQLNYILTGFLYILNIIDASVDANLYNFDVSEDVTLEFEPIQDNFLFARRPAAGLTLRYRF